MNMNSSQGLESVNISLLPSDGKISKLKSTPLVVSPRWDSSLEFVCKFLKANRGWVDDMMVEYGAVLFRGFEIESSADCENAIHCYQPNLNNTYRGTSPRNVMEGTEYVFSAAEVPVNYPIAQHIEMSFLESPPRQLFFGCLQESKSSGGETALCDFRKVYQDVPSGIRSKLLRKKMRYTRTHRKRGARFTYDVSDMLGWGDLFGTSDKTEVERICKEEGISVSWIGPQGDTFRSVSVSEPFQHHPITNEPVWFNHSQVFHWTTFPVELFYAFLRTYEWRLLVQCLLVSVFCVLKYGLLRQKMSLDASYGDGSPISAWEMYQIRKAIHKNMVFNRWKSGDVLFIDNFSTSHGRQPTYDKGRKVVVAWSDPMTKTNTLTYSKTSYTNETQTGYTNPQEQTLTSDEAKELQAAAISLIAAHASPDAKWNFSKDSVKKETENLQERTLTLEEAEELENSLGKRNSNAVGKLSKESSTITSPDFWKDSKLK